MIPSVIGDVYARVRNEPLMTNPALARANSGTTM